MAEQKQETPRVWPPPRLWLDERAFYQTEPYGNSEGCYMVPESELARARQEAWVQALKVAEYQFDTTGSGSMMLASMRKAAESEGQG